MRFTSAQEAAIRADNRELLVSAAAGSVKDILPNTLT